MNRIWVPVFALVVFSAGVGAGITGMVAYRQQQPPPAAPERTQGLAPARLTALLAKELQLTPDQEAQLETILQARRLKFMALRDEVRQQFQRNADGLADEIRTILTPEQRKSFDAFAARVRSRFLRTGTADLQP